MSKQVETGTDRNFEEVVVKSELPVLVDFWAPWCGPCRAVAPVLEQIAEDYRGEVKVVKVNVDEEKGVASRMNVRSIPTIALFNQGRVVDTVVGARPREHFVALLAKIRPN
ncbi:MAG: thioredoxin [Polyangia bacterium]|jgi:thioredoxin 1|nr:thioredoxin [Polyangia bacterium]